MIRLAGLLMIALSSAVASLAIPNAYWLLAVTAVTVVAAFWLGQQPDRPY